jgi:hypothetical protein
MAIYTTKEQIGRKLRGRLRVLDPLPLSNIAGYGQTVTSQAIDPDLLEEVLDQEEAFLNLCLGQFYQMPLRLQSDVTVKVLNQIIDNLVISHLLQIHFEGTSPMSGAGETGNMISDLRRKGEILLAKITAGSNVFDSVSPGPQGTGFPSEIQPLVLPGELVLSRGDRPDLITRNYSVTEINETSAKYRKEFPFANDKDDCCGGSGLGRGVDRGGFWQYD